MLDIFLDPLLLLFFIEARCLSESWNVPSHLASQLALGILCFASQMLGFHRLQVTTLTTRLLLGL